MNGISRKISCARTVTGSWKVWIESKAQGSGWGFALDAIEKRRPTWIVGSLVTVRIACFGRQPVWFYLKKRTVNEVY
jgi:hypothetical protein